MNDYQKAELAAKIAARNRCNKAANELYPRLAEIFRPMVGKKVVKVDGDLVYGCRTNDLRSVLDVPGCHVYRYCSVYSLMWCVKCSENIVGQSGCVYQEASVYVASLSGQICEKIDEWTDLKTDYNLDDLVAKIDAAELAREEYDRVKGLTFPFSEYVR